MPVFNVNVNISQSDAMFKRTFTDTLYTGRDGYRGQVNTTPKCNIPDDGNAAADLCLGQTNTITERTGADARHGREVEAAKKVTEADIKAMRDKIKTTTANISKYQTNSAAFDGQISEAQAEKEKLDLEITYMNEAIYQTEELITQYQTLIAERKTEIIDKQAEVERKYEAFSSLLRTSYENGMLTLAELLVSSDNLIEFLTRSDNLGSMLNYQQSLTEDLDAEITGLKALKANLEQQKQDYTETLGEYEGLLSDLEDKLALQEKYLKKLEKDKKAAEDAAKKAAADAAKYEKELQQLIKKYEQQIKEVLHVAAPRQPSHDNVQIRVA